MTDRDYLIAIISRNCCNYHHCIPDCSKCKCAPLSDEDIENFADHLLANAITIVRARWKGAGFGDYECSYCGCRVSGNQLKECPECKAIMEG